ncbi:tryptophan synthase subunit beta [Bacillus sp. NEB1478]|uniref:tryptophan synthase subunit beta n=1 Tax=Bacillus sp. NEB1478 TaxID=3073816 RepID=UPI0028736975|nr:tryptophan synthase subunit beta [Bacillus sp. NEB1478]WNB93731.1 tryptophan synthase subunit beta [Bacillus sp. NEB1478]
MLTTTVPNLRGRYGDFGGKYVPETIMFALEELEKAFDEAIVDDGFNKLFQKELAIYSGRPTPLTPATRLSESNNGANIYLKREDLNHTGAHKINNAIGQALLAVRMGKKKIIAETGAGQHGVAAATVAAKYGLTCKVYMGKEDIRRQALNVFRMKLLGAEVVEVTSGSQTLKDATNEAIREWVAAVEDTFYLIGSAVGPHPYPKMVKQFQQVIGNETLEQFTHLRDGKLPEAVVACVGGGSNAIGMFAPFIDKNVQLYGVEAAGLGVETDKHAATLSKGRNGVIHGSLTKLLQTSEGQITEPYSISAGLDYPGIGPEHAYLHETKRVKYEAVTDQESLDALEQLCLTEGILCALESAHAVAYSLKLAKTMSKNESIIVCLSGRGDKDVHTLMEKMEGGDPE